MDSLVAALMIGSKGSVTGIDITPEMIEKAREGAAELGVSNVTFVVGEAEELPFDDASFDVVISNGVIDLIPDRRHAPEGAQVRRPRRDRQGSQAPLTRRLRSS
jgi:arsenite methyltransferase